jgi:transcription elongation factor/antiterminator RfaH
MDKKYWHCVYCKPKNAPIAQRHLENAGLKTFLPLYKIKKKRGGKVIEEIRELFPNYLFVKFGMDDYRLVQYTRGVSKIIIGSESKPAVIDEDIIKAIQNRCVDGFVTLQKNLRSGDKVIIKNGPFEGFEAIFMEEIKAGERVNILLKTISCDLKLEISKNFIEKIK